MGATMARRRLKAEQAKKAAAKKAAAVVDAKKAQKPAETSKTNKGK